MNMTQTVLQAPHPLIAPTSTALCRLVGAGVAVGAAAVLGLAAWLDPSPEGLGTHSQLNLPPCGWILTMDLPCPTCGMTTAFAHAADGNLVASFVTQPMGAVLAVATAIALLLGTYTVATGSRVATLFGRLWGRRAAWLLGTAFAAAWVYKIVAYKEVLG